MSASDTATMTVPPPTILIVDDTPANLAVVVECLQAHGFRVLVAQDGEEGLCRAEFVHPDLILLDVMMPGIDGLETCRRLQVNTATCDIPVIFMTALSDTSHKLAGFAAGAVDYVTKPFDTAEVLARVNTHLALRQSQRRLQEEIAVRRAAEEAVWTANATLETHVRQRTAELETANAGLRAEIMRRQEIEDQLRTAKEQAELGNRAKSEFLANMSHELRTPLNAIIGFAEIMEMELFGPLGEPHYRGYTTDIRDSAGHLLEVIGDILDMSKIEAGKYELSDELVSVATLAGSVVRLVRARAQEAALHLESAIAETLPPLRADPRRLKQILLNLVTNAIKFTPAGGTVTLTANLDGNGQLVLVVADTGIGMSDADLAIAMTPFGQVDSGLNRKREGTGLGLPLTKGLVALHGGTLRIHSAQGEGTVAVVTFPADRVAREQEACGVGRGG